MSFAEGTPTVAVELGGKSYAIGWTMGAMKRAKVLGVLALDWSNGAEAMMAVPSLLWAGMSKSDRESVSVEDVDELVNPQNAAEIIAKIAELFAVSDAPEQAVGNEPPAPPMKARAGGTA